MKYLFYQLYTEDKNFVRQRPSDEMLSVSGIVWDDSLQMAIVLSEAVSDLFIPMEYSDYARLIDAFKTGSSVELSGYYGFNELTDSDFDIERTEKEIEEANNALLSRVRSSNDMSEMKLRVL